MTLSAAIGGQHSDKDLDIIWNDIVQTIKNSDLKFPNFEEDLENSEKISKIEDKVVIIRRCMKIYRIIEKNVFEKYIKSK